MSEPKQVLTTPTLALNQAQAAAALSLNTDTFHRYVEPELKVVIVGRRRLIAVKELERWLDANGYAPGVS